MTAQPLDQIRPITHIVQRQQVIAPQVGMAGTHQFFGLGGLAQLVRQRLIFALLYQPLAVAPGPGQGVGVAQVQA